MLTIKEIDENTFHVMRWRHRELPVVISTHRTRQEAINAIYRKPKTKSSRIQESLNTPQLEFTIPGAREGDAEAKRTREQLEREALAKQPTDKPQSAFNVPDGPLFNLFASK